MWIELAKIGSKQQKMGDVRVTNIVIEALKTRIEAKRMESPARKMWKSSEKTMMSFDVMSKNKELIYVNLKI